MDIFVQTINNNSYIVIKNIINDARYINECKTVFKEKLKNGEIQSTGDIYILISEITDNSSGSSVIVDKISNVANSVFGDRQCWVTNTDNKTKNISTGKYLY